MRTLLPAFLLLAACSTDPVGEGTQIGQEAPCAWIGDTDHAFDEQTPLGFSGADFLDTWSSHTGTLTYNDGTTTRITVTLSHDPDFATFAGGGSVQVELPDCDHEDPRLTLYGELHVVTDDGAIDHTFQGDIYASSATDGSYAADTYGSFLNGSIDLAEYADIVNLDQTRVFAWVDFGAGAAGELVVDAQNEGGTGDDNLTEVASWSD